MRKRFRCIVFTIWVFAVILSLPHGLFHEVIDFEEPIDGVIENISQVYNLIFSHKCKVTVIFEMKIISVPSHIR